MVGALLSDWSWWKASLPISLGGFGIHQASLHAPAAFVSSWVQSTDLIIGILNCVTPSSPYLFSTLELLSNRPEWSSLDNIDSSIRQHYLSRVIDQASFNILTDTAPDTWSKALALSSSVHHDGDWLKVVPSKALGLHIQDRDFGLCLWYWLGVQMCQEGSTCPVCQVVTDGFGDHQVGCRGNGDLIHQHNSLRDTIFSAAQSAALAPRKEVPSLVSSSS